MAQEQASVPPVILVTADDDHLLLREYEVVLAEVTNAYGDGDLSVHMAAELDHLPDLRTRSLFGGTTIVVVREMDKLPASTAAETLKEQIEEYLAAPDPEAVLVLTSRGTQKIRKIASLADEVGRVVRAGVPKPWDERGWRDLIAGEFRRIRRRADASAAEALLQRAGTNAAMISSQVSQICLAHPDVDTITAQHVEDVIEGAGNQGPFAIAEACLEQRDPARTVALVRGALDDGDAPIAILGMLISKARDLLVARSGQDLAVAKARPDRDDRKPRVNPSQVKRLAGTASTAWEVGELQWCIDRLATTDMDLKGNSSLPPDVVLELALLDLATRREPGAPWDPRVPRVPVSR